jgi:phytanoyl-CoA hydroxylase
MLLENEKVKQFNRDGFLILNNFMDKNETDAILNRAVYHINQQKQPIETEEEYKSIKNNKTDTLRRLRQAYNRDVVFSDWMTNEKMTPILEQLLEDKAVLTLAHHNSIMTKMPQQNTNTLWHQDIRYWNFNNDNLISVWLCLMDENQNNGALYFVPASHKVNFSKNQFDEKIYFREDLSDNKSILKDRVSFDLKRGDIVLFHSKTLHGANSNCSDKTKISLVYTVRAKNNKPLPNTRSSSYGEIELNSKKF